MALLDEAKTDEAKLDENKLERVVQFLRVKTYNESWTACNMGYISGS